MEKRTQISPLAEIMGNTEKLDLRTASGTEIPFLCWMDICFSLLDPKADVIAGKQLRVLILVTNEKLEIPIIGFNVIK
jgi:hypothetical protein